MTVLWRYEDRATTPERGLTMLDRHADRWFETGASAGGSFLNTLFDLCGKADGRNLEKLRVAFPEEVAAWTRRFFRAVLVEVPHSEVAMHMMIAGEVRWVIPQDHGMAQVLCHDGSFFSHPITRGEAGLPYDD